MKEKVKYVLGFATFLLSTIAGCVTIIFGWMGNVWSRNEFNTPWFISLVSAVICLIFFCVSIKLHE